MGRIATGIGLGVAGLGFVALSAGIRDGAPWAGPAVAIVVEAALLGIGALAVALGVAWLRRLHARSAVVRGWATFGAGILALLALFLALD